MHRMVDIPKEVLIPAFHSAAYKDRLDVSDLDEYIIVKNFKGSNQFLQLFSSKVQWNEWEKYVTSRASNLCVTTRCRITAPGTCLLSFYSKYLRCWSRSSVSVIHGLDDREAKILCIWLNSSIYLVQLLAFRKETEGAWLEVSKFIFKKMKILNPHELSQINIEQLLQLFEDVKKVEYPCLWKQLAMNINQEDFSKNKEILSKAFKTIEQFVGKRFNTREKIDRTILTILGFSKDESNKIIKNLYTNLLIELARLEGIT